VATLLEEESRSFTDEELGEDEKSATSLEGLLYERGVDEELHVRER